MVVAKKFFTKSDIFITYFCFIFLVSMSSSLLDYNSSIFNLSCCTKSAPRESLTESIATVRQKKIKKCITEHK